MRERVALYGGSLHSEFRPEAVSQSGSLLPLRDRTAHPPVAPDGSAQPINPIVVDEPGGGSCAASSRGRTGSWAFAWLIALEVDAVLDHYRRGPLVLNLIASP